jgi:hypothetical protein
MFVLLRLWRKVQRGAPPPALHSFVLRRLGLEGGDADVDLKHVDVVASDQRVRLPEKDDGRSG